MAPLRARSIIRPNISEADVAAVMALREGKADAAQQHRALDWIMREASRVTDLAYFEDGEGGERASSFAAGRQYVGHLIVEMGLPETLARAKQADAAKLKRGKS